MDGDKSVDLKLGQILEIVDQQDNPFVDPIGNTDDPDQGTTSTDDPAEPDSSATTQEPVEPEGPDNKQESQEPQTSEDPAKPAEPTVDDPTDADEISTAHFNFLKEQGVFDLPEEFEFDGTTEGLLKALEITKENLGRRGFQQVMGNLPESAQKAIAFAAQGGDLTQYFAEVKQFDATNIDLTTQKGQRDAIRKYYEVTTNHTPDKIEKLIDRIAVDENDLKEEAEDAIKYLEEYKQKREQELLEQQEHIRRTQEEETKKFIEETTSTIESLELPKARRSKLKNYMFQPVESNGRVTTSFAHTLEQVKQNPKHLAELANILMDYDPKKGFNLQGVEIKQRSKVIDDFKKKLDNIPVPSKRSQGTSGAKKIDWNTILTQI